MFMASIKFSLVVFVCFLSYTGSSKCDHDDGKGVKVCGGKDLCITVNNETKPKNRYRYSKETDVRDVTIICHYEEILSDAFQNKFTLHWQKDGNPISDYEKCSNIKTTIHLSPDANNTIYTCERIINNAKLTKKKTSIILREISAPSNTDQDGEDYDKHKKVPSIPEETPTPTESLTTKAEDEFIKKSFLESNWIVLTAVAVILIIAIFMVTCVVLKSKKIPKEDKTRLNPKGSRDDIQDVSKDQNTTNCEPKLNDFYTNPKSDTTSEEYCSPYMAMYTQPIPKHIRDQNEDKRRLNPKGSRDVIQDISKDQNTKHTEPDPKSDIESEEYSSPNMATYSQPIPKRLRNPNIQPKPKPKPKPTSIEDYSNTCGLVYDEPSTYNNIAKNTGTMYLNVNKNTGTYDKINKNLKNSESVQFIENMAASYCNTGSEKYNSNVYNEPELYEVPY